MFKTQLYDLWFLRKFFVFFVPYYETITAFQHHSDVTKMKEDERRRLQLLNKKLLEFICRTRRLEDENKELATEVNRLKKQINSPNIGPSQDLIEVSY